MLEYSFVAKRKYFIRALVLWNKIFLKRIIKQCRRIWKIS